MSPQQYAEITALIRREVVPATGCTEPACIALGVSYASELLPEGAEFASIEVILSANMLKNSMGVGIPGTGMIGLPIAVALGAILRQSQRKLQILDGFTPQQLARAKELVDREVISVRHTTAEGIDRLYAETIITTTEGTKARSVIDKTHTGLRTLELDGRECTTSSLVGRSFADGATTTCGEALSTTSNESGDIKLNFDLVYDYATTAPLEDIAFIYEAAQQNKVVGEHAINHKYGHGVGHTIHSAVGRRFMGDSPMTRMLMYTSGACDARMDGAPFTVMSNSGSGNQGITATLPVLTFAESEGKDRESTTRALMMSGLMVVYIKQLLGRLSCLCGMVVSGIGTSAALVYLMGGTREQSGFAIKNMIGNVTGMICDGAKPSCSLKASTGISSAMIAALLAMQAETCTGLEGIVADDIDASIQNLALIGRDAMADVDLRVLELMTQKS